MQKDVSGYEELVNLMFQTTMRNPSLPMLIPSQDFFYPALTSELDILLTKALHNGRLLLPELRWHDESLAIFSDYSGEHKDSQYYVYSFFATAHGVLFGLEEQMQELRNKYFKDKFDKEISYKDIQWGGIKRSLKDYLRLVDRMPGLLLTVVVDKRIGSFFNDDQKALTKLLIDAGYGNWKSPVAEKFLRVAHLITYMIALLAEENQKVFWMSDHDSIFQNNRMQLAGVISGLLPYYGIEKTGIFGFATPFSDRSLMYLDALSVADIAAGALQNYFTQDKRTAGDFLVKHENAEIIDWLGHQSFLKKHCVVFRYINDEEFATSNIAFEMTKVPENTIVVPFYR